MPPDEDELDELQDSLGFPKPKPKEKRKVKHLRRGPLPKVRLQGKREYGASQRQRRMEADREYSHVTRPLYLLRLAQRQGRLQRKISDLPGKTPRDKLAHLADVSPDEQPLCEAALEQTGCKGRRVASTIHHIKGRGKYLNDDSTFSGQCWPCHAYVERNKEWAKERGLIQSRHGKVTTNEDF